MKGTDLGLNIESWDGADHLNKLSLTVRSDFTNQILEGWAVQGDRAYGMKRNAGGLEFGGADWQALGTLLSEVQALHGFPAYSNPYEATNNEANVTSRFRELIKPLIGWSLNLENFRQTNAPPVISDGRVQLFIFARSPESFGITGQDFGREIGYVLYRFDLFKPGS